MKLLAAEDALVVGRISGAHGIKGWVKVLSFTDPKENIFTYQPWFLSSAQGWQPVELTGSRPQGKGIVAQINGCTDRTFAEAEFVGREIAIPKEALPPAGEGEYYWRDLIGLRVRLVTGEDIGVVKNLIATGANDVLVVRGDQHSIDRRERLLPWALGEIITVVQVNEGWLEADWDPTF